MRPSPKPQEMYRHFKGNIYQIRCLARHSETGEMMVVYQAMYDTFQIYVRPLAMFMEEVDHIKYPGAKQKYRFELLQDMQDMDMPSAVQTQNYGQSEILAQAETIGRDGEPVQNAVSAQSGMPTQNTASTQIGMPTQTEEPVRTPDAEEQVQQQKQQEQQEQVHIDPLVMDFLDADTYEQRLNILAALRHRITDDMINTMAAAVELEIKDGDVAARYEELKNCLLTFEKYECNRLR